MLFVPIEREENHFQQPLTAEEIVEACSLAFTRERAIREIRELASGFFNTTYLVAFEDAGKVILRVSPADSSRLFLHERNLLKGEYAIQSYSAPIAEWVPRILFADFSHSRIGRDYMFQSYLEGEVWGNVIERMSKEENERIWAQLGEMMRALNGVTQPLFGPAYPAPSFRKWSDYFLDLLEGRLQDFHRFGLADTEMARLLELARQSLPWLDEIMIASLCHGDHWPNNILVQPGEGGYRISGVLDMERAYWGDPLAEWTFSVMNHPNSFWEAYGDREESPGAAIRMLLYKGDMLANAILESVRFHYEPPRQALREVNDELGGLLRSLPS